MTQNFFKHSPLKKLPYPLYFAGTSLSDIFLFGKIRSVLIRQETSDEIGLLEILTQILYGISDENCRLSFAVGLNLSKTSLMQIETRYLSKYCD
jgi:hypothetical protein